MPRVGFICSAGGASAFAAIDIARDMGLAAIDDFLLITDRSCAAEESGAERGIRSLRIQEEDNNRFSELACDRLAEEEADTALLFFSRMVTAEMFQRIATMNIHPSLLPAFKGLGAARRAHQAGAKFIGATLHDVTEELDGGRIIAQTVHPLRPENGLPQVERISFVQKTYLTLLALESLYLGALDTENSVVQLLNNNTRATPSASPALRRPDLIDAFADFALSWDVDGFLP